MSFVPIERETLAALLSQASAAADASEALRRATQALVEQTDDLAIDAVRRLKERGASAAQVEGYEGAYRSRVAAVREAQAALHAACEGVRGSAQELADV